MYLRHTCFEIIFFLCVGCLRTRFLQRETEGTALNFFFKNVMNVAECKRWCGKKCALPVLLGFCNRYKHRWFERK